MPLKKLVIPSFSKGREKKPSVEIHRHDVEADLRAAIARGPDDLVKRGSESSETKERPSNRFDQVASEDHRHRRQTCGRRGHRLPNLHQDFSLHQGAPKGGPAGAAGLENELSLRMSKDILEIGQIYHFQPSADRIERTPLRR